MCIRDSCKAIKYNDSKKLTSDNNNVENENIINSVVVAVSYTHLDVYKRQIYVYRSNTVKENK